MKNLIIISVMCLLFSCGYSGVEKLISDYEQTVGTTKTDLNLKIVSLKKVDTWIVGDTIRKRKQADRAVGIQKPDSVYLKQELLYSKQDTNAIQAYRYKCTYTINNPLLNGAKQEITHEYLINSTLTEIIQRIGNN